MIRSILTMIRSWLAPKPLIDIKRKRASLRKAHLSTSHLETYVGKHEQLRRERYRGRN